MRNAEVKRRQIQMLSNALMIGVLLILGNNTGDMGLMYLAVAIEVSGFFIAVLSGQMADVLGKLLRSRSAKHQYRNVILIKRYIGILQVILGVIGTILFLILSGPMSNGLFAGSYSKYLFMIMAPLILLRTLTHILLGYFQGEGNELPTVVTLVARPFFLLVLGLHMSKSFKEQGMQVADLLKQDAYQYVYAAMGVAWAMVIIELILLIALALFYIVVHGHNKKKNSEGHKSTDSMQSLVRIVLKNRWQPMLLGILMSLPLWVMLIGINRESAVSNYESFSMFYVKVLGFFGIIIFSACALALPLHNRAVYILKNEGSRYASESMRRAVLFICVIMAFLTGFNMSMKDQIAKLLSSSKMEQLSGWLFWGAFLLLLCPLVYFFMRILYLLGKRLLLLALFGVSDLLFIILTVFAVTGHGMAVDVLIRNLLIYVLVLCLLLGFFCCCYFKLGAELVVPGLSTALATALMYVIQITITSILAPHLGNAVTMLVIFILTSVLYCLAILLLRIFRDNDFEALPGGRVLLALGQMLHLY